MVSVLWGITALTTLVPVAPAPAPSPAAVNWTLELLRLFVPPILTLLGALFGAWIGFDLANRGRKYEILYRERFKGFEAIATYAYSIRDTSKEFRIYLASETRTDPEGLYVFGEFAEDKVLMLEETKANRSSAVLLSDESKNNLGHLLVAHFKTKLYMQSIVWQGQKPDKETNPEVLRGKIERLNSDLADLEQKAEALIESAFRDVDLPRK
ncbi:hypothetical protein [Deinococcus sp. Leaf326]|uniref:hypothetical protein n=1 Tax=Deinococcus sp. Leaf326 TaxID=1736338 RepID=UPI000AA618A0|nr:hypothetical protein [Deinococcus sp. Leaf326]